MSKKRFYNLIAVSSVCIGVGMIVGGSLGGGEAATPYWGGGIIILLGSVVAGMAIATNGDVKKAESDTTNSSGE